jgi:hypothetical protein
MVPAPAPATESTMKLMSPAAAIAVGWTKACGLLAACCAGVRAA